MVAESTRRLGPAGQIAGTPWRTLRTLADSNGLLIAVEHTRTAERRTLWLLSERSAGHTSPTLPAHPRLARILGSGRTGRRAPFLLLERLDGELLADRLRKAGALSAPHAVELAACVFEALAALHDAGLCHGAVSTAAILALPDAGAKLLSASPEPASASGVQRDLERAAIVLFEALTGRLPLGDSPTWEGSAPPAWRSTARLHDALPGVAPELSSLVSALLGARPPAAAVAAARLRRVLMRQHAALATEAPTVIVRRAAPPPVLEATTDTDELPTKVMPALDARALDAPTIVDPPGAGFWDAEPARDSADEPAPRRRAAARMLLVSSALASFVMSCFAVAMVTWLSPRPVAAPMRLSPPAPAAATPATTMAAAAVERPSPSPPASPAPAASVVVAASSEPPAVLPPKRPRHRARSPRPAAASIEADAACVTSRGVSAAGF